MHGDLIKEYSSNHRVTSAEGLHFKQMPIHPLMEYAIHALFYRIAGDLTPSTELVRFEVDGEKVYPVLISSTIEGTTLRDKPSLQNVQWSRWTWLLLCSILTRPGDGLFSNYVLDPNGNIFCIDNDISFADPIVQKGHTSWINFCSALFCHFHERPLDRAVLQEFCALDADAILEGWINDVIQKENEYLNMFSKEERTNFYNEDPNNRFKLKALLRKGTLSTLNLQFVFLQNQLSEFLRKGMEVTSQELLKQIIYIADNFSISAAAGRKISQLYFEAKKISIDQQLGWITNRSHGKSLSSLRSDESCLGYIPTFEEVESRGSLSPQKAKEELAASLLQRSVSFFSIGNIDGQKTLRANFKEMKLVNNEPDTERQEHVLKALICLTSISNEKMSAVAIQNCAVINTRSLEPFLHQGIEYLDLRNCPRIYDKDVVLLQTLPKLKELHLSGCTGLKTVADKGVLSNGPLTFSSLKLLNIDECPNLKEIRLRSPFLKEIRLKKNPQLRYVEIGSSVLFVNTSKEDNSNIRYIEKYILLSDWSKLLIYHEYLNDHGLVLDAIKKEGLETACKYITAEMKNSREFILSEEKLFKFASDELLNDKEFILAAVQQNWLSLEFVSSVCRKEKEIVLTAVRSNGKALQFASEELRNNIEIVLAAVRSNGIALQYASQELKNDDAIVLEAIIQDGSALEFAVDKLKINKFFRLFAVRRYGEALKFADVKLKNDKNIVLKAVKQDGIALQYASDECKNHREIVIEAVKSNGLALQYASDECKNHREIVIEAVKSKGLALQFASDRLRDQEQVVIQAIKIPGRFIFEIFKSPSPFKYASERLKINKKFVLEAMQKNRDVLDFAHEEIKKEILRDEYPKIFASEDSKNDRKKILAAVKVDGFALQFVCDNFKNDREIVSEAVFTYVRSLEYASQCLKDDKQFMLNLILKRIAACEYASERLRNDHEFMLAAIKIDGSALHFASERLKNDREIVLAAANAQGKVLRYLNDKFKNDREIVLAAVKNDASAFTYASFELKSCKKFILEVVSHQGCALNYLEEEDKSEAEIVLASVRNNGNALQYASSNLRKDKNIVLIAVKQNGNALQYASIECKSNREIVSTAVRKNGEALQFANEKLADDEEIVIHSVHRPFFFNSESLYLGFKFASNRLKADQNFVLRAMKFNIGVLEYSEQLMNDKDFVIRTLQINAQVFEYASLDCRNDEEIVLMAIFMRAKSFEYASDRLKNNKEFVLTAILKDPEAFKYASRELKDNKEFVLLAVSKEGRVLQFVSNQFKQDNEIVLASVQQNGECLEYASDLCKNKREVVLIAVRNNGLALNFAAIKLRRDKEIVLVAVKQCKYALTFADKSIVNDSIFDPYRK